MDIKDKMFAEFFLIKRKDLGLTQVELAKKAELSQGLITQIENIKKKPSKSVIIKLYKALTPNSESLSDEEIFRNIRSENVFPPKRNLNRMILMADDLIRDKEHLYNLEEYYDHVLTLNNIGWAHPIAFGNKIISLFSEIENIPEKYACINFFDIDGIQKGDYIVIKYYDSYNVDDIIKSNIIKNDIFVIQLINQAISETGGIDLILSKISMVKYFFDSENTFYIVEYSGKKILLKKNDFKIKGRCILTIHQERPEFNFFELK